MKKSNKWLKNINLEKKIMILIDPTKNIILKIQMNSMQKQN